MSRPLMSLSFALCVALRTSAAFSAEVDDPAFVTISAPDLTPTATIPTDFVGLSFDRGPRGLTSGFFAPENRSLIALLSLLGRSGSLRFGGTGSADARTSSITPSTIDNLHRFMRALGPGWTLIYGLNIDSRDPDGAAREVGYVESAFGPGFAMYQFGNEPDGDRRNFPDEAAYIAEWRNYHAVIHAAYPRARFAGPDISNSFIAGRGWIPQFISSLGARVAEITQHYYTGPRTVTPTTLLANAIRGLQARAVSQTALAAPLPSRITESNTEEPGGLDGVSNVAAAAPWAVLETIILSQAGWAGVNFHGGPNGNFYSPFRLSGSTWSPSPIFSGLVLAHWVDGASLLPVKITGGSSAVWGIAMLSPSHETEFLLVNVDVEKARRVKVVQQGGWSKLSVLMEESDGPSSPVVTLGGAPIGASGEWRGAPKLLARGEILTLPPASAALVVLE